MIRRKNGTVKFASATLARQRKAKTRTANTNTNETLGGEMSDTAS
jgi:hypothetical protein